MLTNTHLMPIDYNAINGALGSITTQLQTRDVDLKN